MDSYMVILPPDKIMRGGKLVAVVVADADHEDGDEDEENGGSSLK